MDGFLSGAAEAGDFDSEGEFSVDWVAADRKLEEFYRQHPGLWVVKFIQTALALRATGVHVERGYDRLTLACSLFAAGPSLRDLLLVRSEAQEYLVTGIKAVFACEPELDKVTLISVPHQGQATRVVLKRQMSGVEQEEVGQGVYRDLLFGTSQKGSPFYISLTWSNVAWWRSAARRLRREILLRSVCKERLGLCPVPIFVQGQTMGMGSGKPFPALAVEYVVAPLTADVVVRELEPGHGSRTLDIFGTRVEKLGAHRRLLTRWSSADGELLAGSSEHPLVDLEILAKASWGLSGDVKTRLPPDRIGVFRTASFLGYRLVAHVLLREEYRIFDFRGVTAQPALPTLLCITILPDLRGEGRAFFYRRGIFLGVESMELGIPGVEVHASCEFLRTDFSGMAVVRDESFARLEALIRERVLLLARDTVAAFPGGPTRRLKRALKSFDAANRL